LIIDALKNLFSVKPADVQEAVSPIKILQNICIEHEELIEPMLQNLSVSFITYYYDASTQQGMDFGDQVSSQAEKFIDNIADYFQIVLDSFKNEIVNSTMLDKMKIMKMTKFIANKFITKETNNMSRKSSYHRGTILGILNQITQIDLSEIDRLSPKDFQLLKFGAQTVTVLVEPLLDVTTNNENILLEVCGDETFVGSLASFIDSVSKMLKTYSRQGNEVNLGPTYYTIYDLCLFTIKAFEYTQILQPLAPGEIPEWLIQIFICIKSQNSAIADICLDSCMVILRTFKNLKNEDEIQYNKIWIRLRNDVLFSSKIDGSLA
jgi:hypothetical protein